MPSAAAGVPQIEIAGYLHDIGKIYIPLAILENKLNLAMTKHN